jgi:NAD(P)-dependent dehydrogenase (short-subunit alcohol dehydrogenase family)
MSDMRSEFYGATMRLTQLFPIAKPITFLLLASFLATGAAHAAGKAAVFQFELEHGDLVPGAPEKHEAENKRLAMISERLRGHLAEAGFQVVDVTPFAAKAAAANLQACGNCADDFARELGADYAFTGVVYKVSELVLSMSVLVHEAATSRPMTSATVDLRGNTDESWRRAIDYLFRNVLSARLETLKK